MSETEIRKKSLGFLSFGDPAKDIGYGDKDHQGSDPYQNQCHHRAIQ